MKKKQVSKIALKAGEILLKNGAETFRIEETVGKICESYGFSAECVSLPYGLFLSIGKDEENKTTMMKKVSGQQFDMHKIELVNELSRLIANSPLEYDEAMKRLNVIQNSPNFSVLVQCIAAAITGAVYAVFFNGSFLDAIAAGIISFLVFFVVSKVKPTGVFQYVIQSVAGFLIGFLSIFSSFIFPVLNNHIINTGAIMILVPGILLTNGMKDFVFGDFSSGMAKVFQAILILAAVAVGVGAALVIGNRWFGIS